MKISVALCTYNGEQFLQQQLESISRQTRLPDELVACDDVSNDATLSILEEFSKSAPFSVNLVRNSKNLGAIKNFESAVSLCSGHIIFLCDQDDVWAAEKVETMSLAFANEPELGMVFSDGALVDSKLVRLASTLWEQVGLVGRASDIFDSNPFPFLLTDHNVVTGAGAAFSHRAIARSLPFPQPMAIFHDGWLALIASAIGGIKRIPLPLFSYRQHASQQLGVRKLSPDFGVNDYDRHLCQLMVLRDRIGSDLSLPNHALLNDYIDHLQVRLSLSPMLIKRGCEVSQEYLLGRYDRYSSGIKSAAKDVFRGISTFRVETNCL
jgi:glycosyltransferase involved in cell wall biosynthesis